MRRLVIGFASGVVVVLAGATIFYFARPTRSWQEQSIRSQASAFACTLVPGLNTNCMPIASLRKLNGGDGYTWLVEYGNSVHHRCYELHPFGVPLRRATCR